MSVRVRSVVEALPRRISLRSIDRLAKLREGTTQRLAADVDARPGGDVVAALAVALGVTTDWLLLGRGQEPDLSQVAAQVVASVEAAERDRRHVRKLTPTDAARKRSIRSAVPHGTTTE